jgi:hypothetical protein
MRWVCGFTNVEGDTLVIGRNDRDQAARVEDHPKRMGDMELTLCNTVIAMYFVATCEMNAGARGLFSQYARRLLTYSRDFLTMANSPQLEP